MVRTADTNSTVAVSVVTASVRATFSSEVMLLATVALEVTMVAMAKTVFALPMTRTVVVAFVR